MFSLKSLGIASFATILDGAPACWFPQSDHDREVALIEQYGVCTLRSYAWVLDDKAVRGEDEPLVLTAAGPYVETSHDVVEAVFIDAEVGRAFAFIEGMYAAAAREARGAVDEGVRGEDLVFIWDYDMWSFDQRLHALVCRREHAGARRCKRLDTPDFAGIH